MSAERQVTLEEAILLEQHNAALRSKPNPYKREIIEARVMVDGRPVRLTERAGVVIAGYEPGNGSRYDLEILPRADGGYLLVWDGAGVYGRLYPSEALHGSGPAEWLIRAGRSNPVDHRAIEQLCGELFRRGVLKC